MKTMKLPECVTLISAEITATCDAQNFYGRQADGSEFPGQRVDLTNSAGMRSVSCAALQDDCTCRIPGGLERRPKGPRRCVFYPLSQFWVGETI